MRGNDVDNLSFASTPVPAKVTPSQAMSGSRYTAPRCFNSVVYTARSSLADHQTNTRRLFFVVAGGIQFTHGDHGEGARGTMVYSFDHGKQPVELEQKVEELNAKCVNWSDAECELMFLSAYDATERKMEGLLGIGSKRSETLVESRRSSIVDENFEGDKFSVLRLPCDGPGLL